MNIKILDPNPETGEGEIAVFSRNVFVGYAKEEAKTKETFTDDGWLKTGDLGVLDKDGFLKITGRIKELIITEGGKNIAPVPIEDAIKSKLKQIISQAIVIGDNKKYLSCLLTLKVAVNPETMLPTTNLDLPARKWCRKVLGSKAKQVNTIQDFTNGPHSLDLVKEIQKAVDDCNTAAESHAHKVQKFCILPEEFSIAGGEFGPTLKLRRHIIVQKHKKFIDMMYDGNWSSSHFYDRRYFYGFF